MRYGRLVGVGLAALLLAPVAQATSLPFTGTLEFQFAVLPPVVLTGSGVAIVNGSAAGTHLDTLAFPAGVFAASHLVAPVTDPLALPIQGVQLTVMNGAGTFSGGAGVIPLAGVARVCLFGPCPSAVANLYIPLSAVGVGGTHLITGSVNLTVVGAPWTTGTVAIGSLTQMGTAHGPASGSSSTAQGSGVLRLVTPILINTNLGVDAVIPAFAIMTLHFIPEPATLALTCGGLALLAAAGRARLRRR